MRVRKAVIPAAGLGTRFLPATKAQPKEMLPIVDKPGIQYIVEEAIKAGIEEILIITGRNKTSIINHFDRAVELEHNLKEKNKIELLQKVEEITDMANLHYVRQIEPKGLGHAILCAKTFVGEEPFAVLLGDDIVHSEEPCVKQLINVFEKERASVLGVQTVDPSQVDKYGIVDGEKLSDRTYKVNDMVEKPSVENAPSNVAILGRYILTPKIFELLEKTEPGKGGEIQLTDAIKALAEFEDIYAYDFKGQRYDTGDKLGYLKATVEFGMQHEDVGDAFKEYLKGICKEI
ncbi:MAG: UTP--glucose-1-phosphate uridylyltransferase GalU [Tissierellales bacterium]|jgi:UTP--glucose-1-phosphate uridylyltransferase|nr:UTP--glucose-1-phosphate uridylyltransferase GalU [Tissierellales bacterium]